jgi:hypothetical protein
MGRPRIEITETMIAEAQRLAGLGLTKEQVALSLGIHRDTLRKKESEYIGLFNAIKRGRVSAIVEVSNALFQAALAGNITAQIFWLKNMAPESFSDNPQPATDEDSTPEKIQIVVVDGRRKDKDGNPVEYGIGRDSKKEAA